MPELTRDALFEALRRRRHYGTTGTRLFLDVRGTFERTSTGFSEDPQARPRAGVSGARSHDGRHHSPEGVPMKLSVEVIGTAPLDRVDVLHGTQVVQSARPFTAADLGRRVRILWQGAEYRGRGRETMWQGKLAVTGNRIARFAPVNFLNPERKVQETAAGTALAWTSVTTGNLAGIDLWLDEAARRHRCGSRPISCRARSSSASSPTVPSTFDGGGLGRKLSVYRLPETDWSRRLTLDASRRIQGRPPTCRSTCA